MSSLDCRPAGPTTQPTQTWRRWALWLGWLWLSPLGAGAETLRVYGDEAYAPVIYLEQGRAQGILPAIFARLEQDTGDRYELVLVPWARAVRESQRGSGGITNVSRTKAREALYDFSEPMYYDEIQLVALKGHEFAFKQVSDLRGKTVGGASGASYGDAFDQAAAQGLFTLEPDPNQQSRLRKLLHGRMDVAIIGNGQAGLNQLLASAPDLAAARPQLVVLPTPLLRDPLHLAFAKTMHKQAALTRFNQALAKLKTSPEYPRLLQAPTPKQATK